MQGRIFRRSFQKQSSIVPGAVAVCNAKVMGSVVASQPDTSEAFLTEEISINALPRASSKNNRGITGKIGITLHSDMPHGPTPFPVEPMEDMQPHNPNTAIWDRNVLYPGLRDLTNERPETLSTNRADSCRVDIADTGRDVMFPAGMREFLGARLHPHIAGEP